MHTSREIRLVMSPFFIALLGSYIGRTMQPLYSMGREKVVNEIAIAAALARLRRNASLRR